MPSPLSNGDGFFSRLPRECVRRPFAEDVRELCSRYPSSPPASPPCCGGWGGGDGLMPPSPFPASDTCRAQQTQTSSEQSENINKNLCFAPKNKQHLRKVSLQGLAGRGRAEQRRSEDLCVTDLYRPQPRRTPSPAPLRPRPGTRAPSRRCRLLPVCVRPSSPGCSRASLCEQPV